MDEPKRFLRYLTPGTVFLAEMAPAIVFVYLLLFGKFHKHHVIWVVEHVAPILALAAAAAVTSGLMLSQIYHFLTGVGMKCFDQADFEKVLKDAVKRRLITMEDVDIPCDRLSNHRVKLWRRAEYWRRFSALWHVRIQDSSAIRGANPRADSLHDLHHGLGASLVGACVAALTNGLIGLIWVCMQDWHPASKLLIGLLFVILMVALIYGHFSAFRRAEDNSRRFVVTVLMSVLKAESECLAEGSNPKDVCVVQILAHPPIGDVDAASKPPMPMVL